MVRPFVHSDLANVPTNWSVNGTADFNGDGKTDILWRNTSNDVGIWLMNGSTVTSAPTIGNVGPTWSVVGLGDFNYDGKGDILWRNTANDLGIWLMNGTTITSAPTIGNVSAAWAVASVGDYGSDGKADILLRSSNNDIGIWFMNGSGDHVRSDPWQRRAELDRAERSVELNDLAQVDPETGAVTARRAFAWSGTSMPALSLAARFEEVFEHDHRSS